MTSLPHQVLSLPSRQIPRAEARVANGARVAREAREVRVAKEARAITMIRDGTGATLQLMGQRMACAYATASNGTARKTHAETILVAQHLTLLPVRAMGSSRQSGPRGSRAKRSRVTRDFNASTNTGTALHR